MAIQYYDKAVADKLQNWINDPNLHIYRPEDMSWMLQQKSDEARDWPIKLPFIALSRQTEINIGNTNRRPLSYSGLTLRLYDDKTNEEVQLKSAYKLNAIPMSLNYQLDIYTKGMEEACEYVRNFIFNLVNFPKVAITIPYNGIDLKHNSTIQVNPQVEDNSDIPMRLFPGQFTRFTIRFTLDDAYMFSVVNRENVSIESVSLEVVERKVGNDAETEVEFLDVNSQ